MAPKQRDMISDEAELLLKVVETEAEEANVAPILAATRHLQRENGSIVGREVAETIASTYPSFASCLPLSVVKPGHAALASIDGRAAVSHARIHEFVMTDYGPALHQLGFGKGCRIALILPNGPELALAIFATAQWASCVPLSANGAASELEADLARCGADLVIGPYSAGDIVLPENVEVDPRFHVMDRNSDSRHFQSIQASAAKLKIPFVGLVPSPYEAGIFRLVHVPSSTSTTMNQTVCFPDLSSSVKRLAPLRQGPVDTDCNSGSDEVLVLFTSGTTGNKKLVPHQCRDMLTASTIIALSWNLTTADVNCNLMPLFHVGGIVRQVFSPLISGGCVICCPSFDPSIFWALLRKEAFTWYYAAPTMHQLILQTYDASECPNPRLKMIANAAGGLLPSLAIKLKETFGANVLPSYGMTECMPISSPPATYQLTKTGTSGVPVGPEVRILDVATLEPFGANVEGPICVRGEPCFRGYGVQANDPTAAMPASFLKDGWFDTGDLGYLDEDGYLYITGRSKEVINRGGEIISPMEVEEAVMSHPDVSACVAFSAGHAILQEVVGLALVMKAGRPRLDLASLHVFLGDCLGTAKWPQCLIYLDSLPKSHTNKLLRVKLARRLGLPDFHDDMPLLERTFEGTCPPQGAPLDVAIPSSVVSVSAAQVEQSLRLVLIEDLKSGQDLKVIANPDRAGSLVCYIYKIDVVEAIGKAKESLDGYAVPTHFVVMTEPIQTLSACLPRPTARDAVITLLQQTKSRGPVDPLVESVQCLFVELLKLDYSPGPDDNFFHIGGSSMLASQLGSKIRKQFGVPCNGAEIFQYSTSEDLAKMIRKRSYAHSDDTTATSDTTGYSDSDERRVSDQGAPFPSKQLPFESTFLASLVQLLPGFVILPLFQVTRYMLFFALLLRSINVLSGSTRDLWTFVLAYLAFHLCWISITPLIFVAIKWLVIGRYREGRYPIWGRYVAFSLQFFSPASMIWIIHLSCFSNPSILSIATT
jgi:acyl-CoA synthetase (AMP-forming)/AMP-acid ligase II/acyl carrier protein